ncbi:MAG: rod-binding protein [Amphiplicatus sp.]
MDVAAASAAISPAATARIDRAAQDFEALVIAQLLAPIFSSVETPGLAGGGPGEKAFSGLLQEEYARSIVSRGGFGITDQVKAALIELQTGASQLSSL